MTPSIFHGGCQKMQYEEEKSPLVVPYIYNPRRSPCCPDLEPCLLVYRQRHLTVTPSMVARDREEKARKREIKEPATKRLDPDSKRAGDIIQEIALTRLRRSACGCENRGENFGHPNGNVSPGGNGKAKRNGGMPSTCRSSRKQNEVHHRAPSPVQGNLRE
ncbi:hypothetical protein Micbo1qcDRAFT_71156 [Microdochium bolleyi]|uniref:Uncharacterized protein n=1 Tax=Microdochium bolleyi TaxID=196109 RepID=A0A136J0K4_9PEZI|nr:hypothetical protein Micbo1qcDRAFT_71156 [Microdochium bolleyi]